MGPEKGLNDYLQILKSPDVYPDISGAGFFMSPIIAVASNIVALLGMLALVILILRVGVDIVMVSGLGGMIEGKSDGLDRSIRMLATKNVEQYVGDPIEYAKNIVPNTLLMFAFVGLMVSGQLLPLAGTVTATTGAVISRVAKINPVPYVENLSINVESLRKGADRSSISQLIKQYNIQVANMSSALNAYEGKTDIKQEEYEDIARAYYVSHNLADMYAFKLEIERHNSRVRSQKDQTKLTRDEQRLLELGLNSHTIQNNQLYKSGREFYKKMGGSNIEVANREDFRKFMSKQDAGEFTEQIRYK